MRYTFGLIGSGNMGGAIARAVSLTLKDGILADHSPQRAQELAAELGFSSGTNEDAARESQYLFLGVKPHLMGGMLEGIRPTLASRETSPILVSMAAGLTIAQIQQMAGQKYPVIRHHAKHTCGSERRGRSLRDQCQCHCGYDGWFFEHDVPGRKALPPGGISHGRWRGSFWLRPCLRLSHSGCHGRRRCGLWPSPA